MNFKNFLKNSTKILFLVLSMCLIMSRPIEADVGYFSSYDSGGSSSSSSSSSGSSWSSGSSSYGGSSYRSRSSSSDDSEGSLGGAIVVLIIIIIIVLLSRKGNGTTSSNIQTPYVALINNTKSVEETIRKEDPMFSAENFMAFGKEVFLKLQTSWSERKWEGIRPFESNELFEQHSKQLQQLIDANQINIMDRICVRETSLISFRKDGDKEIIEMGLKSAAKDYTIEADTKKVVQGNPNADVYMVYTMTFMRKAGVKTKEGTDKKSTTNCPNCGAPTKITSAGKCEYCGSIITTGEHDWVLSNLQGRRGK